MAYCFPSRANTIFGNDKCNQPTDHRYALHTATQKPKCINIYIKQKVEIEFIALYCSAVDGRQRKMFGKYRVERIFIVRSNAGKGRERVRERDRLFLIIPSDRKLFFRHYYSLSFISCDAIRIYSLAVCHWIKLETRWKPRKKRRIFQYVLTLSSWCWTFGTWWIECSVYICVDMSNRLLC